MGGKSYFCDYCRCYMKNDKNVRKTHNEGVAHNIIKTSIMRKYEDPRKIYEEEIKKQSCARYFKSYCKYDLFCHYTHYSDIQLKQLKEIVDNLKPKSQSTETTSKRLDSKGFEKIPMLPWKNSLQKAKLKLLPVKLPSSIRPLNLSKLSKFDVNKTKWG